MSSPGESQGRGVRPSLAVLAVLAVLAGGVALAATLALTQSWHPMPSPHGTVGSASPNRTASLYDPDGIPRMLADEPVLRGVGIGIRAAGGDPAPFIVAGWPAQDPSPTCAPSVVRCGFTSLVDAPGSNSIAAVTLDWPSGAQFSFNWGRQWAGGFYVLRVRAACTYWSSVCLVVEEEIEPQGALPTVPDGFGADGLPLTVDGQPVARGPDVADRLRLNWATQPAWVAGRVEAVPPVDETCPDPVTWDAHPCPAIRLADPDLGVPFSSGPTVQVSRWGLEEAWSPGMTWPGGYVVLLTKAHSVLGYVLPPDVTPTPALVPMPSLDFSGWAVNTRVIEIAGRPVRSGEQIVAYLATAPPGAFLVTGAVQARGCAACTGGAMTMLVESPLIAGSVGTEFRLLRADGSDFTPGTRMVWTDPAGIVVLEVRRYTGACRSGISCADAFEVVRVAVPPS